MNRLLKDQRIYQYRLVVLEGDLGMVDSFPFILLPLQSEDVLMRERQREREKEREGEGRGERERG